MNKLHLSFTILLIIICIPTKVLAKKVKYKTNDPMLMESGRCISHFRKFERKHRIPRDLLYSISLQESGRYHKQSGKKIPWPWTVNSKGKGYYFPSKSDAMMFAMKEIKNGNKSIDVGCMQINMRYHGDKFKSIAEAFDPHSNVSESSEILKAHYKKKKNWKKSVAMYHSSNKKRGKNYQKSVADNLKMLSKNKFNYKKASKLAITSIDTKTKKRLIRKK